SPSPSPATRLKLDGGPAGSTVAVTTAVPTVICTGAATIAPSGGATAVYSPAAVATTPSCRLMFPVGVVRLPIVMVPWLEFEATQTPSVLTPSVASIAGSSTGHRKYGVQNPGPTWNTMSAPVALPAEFIAITRKW